MDALDVILRDADPGIAVDDRWTSALFAEITEQAAARRARSRAWRIVPVVIIGTAALTGAAVAVAVTHGQLGVNGNSVNYDIVVPIEYVDAGGTSHSCSYGIYVGDGETKSPEATQLINWFNDRNWDGVGQQVFNYAEERRGDGIEGPKDYQHQAAFFSALDRILLGDIPADLITGDTVVAGSSTCDGKGLSW